ncbi:MAG: alpha/beta hydrolase [Hamadaea sp.]|nr:alpha/beta hydrolase [Hamadaea sp.]
MTTMVLVPGMWLGAQAWQDVADKLTAAGHDVHPVTLPGVGDRAAEATAGTDLDAHVDDVIALFDRLDLRDVVLVGHSYGGMVVSTAAGRLADRIKRVVYVDSGPLPEGVSQFDTTAPEEQERTRVQVGDGFLVPPPSFDPADMGSEMLAGLDESTLARMRSQATPHPYASVTQPVHYTPAYASLPQTLVTCMFPAAMVQQMIDDGHPFFALLKGADVVELPTGHWPMFSRPDDLAAVLGVL